MSVSIYDKALINKFKKWVQDESMTITAPDETRRLFEYQADIHNDEPLKLPIIAIRRDPTVRIGNVSKKPTTFDGWRKDADYDKQGNQKVNQLNSIPIEIIYQIDIYTRYAEEAEEYVREFVFNIINYPKLEIEIPYNNSKLTHISNIRLEPDLVDNSDIPERLIAGQFTRKTISIYIDDAYLYDYKVKDAIQIDDSSIVDLKFKLHNEE